MEREQVKIISDDPEGYCLKYREDIVLGDRKFYPPPDLLADAPDSDEIEPKKRKVKDGHKP